MTLQNRHGCEARTRISCHASLDPSRACAFQQVKAHELFQSHRVPQEIRARAGINPEHDMSAVGAALYPAHTPSLSDPPLHNEQETRTWKTSVLCFPAANGAMCRADPGPFQSDKFPLAAGPWGGRGYGHFLAGRSFLSGAMEAGRRLTEIRCFGTPSSAGL
jgi:hypothetical protein